MEEFEDRKEVTKGEQIRRWVEGREKGRRQRRNELAGERVI